MGIGSTMISELTAICEGLGLRAANDPFSVDQIPATLRDQDAFMVKLLPFVLKDGQPGMNRQLPISRDFSVQVVIPVFRTGIGVGANRLTVAQKKAADIEESLAQALCSAALSNMRVVNPLSIGTEPVTDGESHYLVVTALFQATYSLTI